MPNLDGSRVLVAGGTGNVGRHVVAAVLAAGGTAIVPSRSPDRLDAVVRRHEQASASLLPILGDIAEERDGRAIVARVGPLDGAVASLGSFVAAPNLLEASPADLRRAFEGYVGAHFGVARAVIPALEPRGGGFVMINGPLAFDPLFPGTGLVSIATAAQAMLARVLMKELASSRVRVNEVVVYSSFGRGDDEKNEVTGEDIGRTVAYLVSARGGNVRGQTVHLRSREMVRALGE